MSKSICSVASCDNPARSRCLCESHYKKKMPELRRAASREAQGLPGERWLPVFGYEGFYEVSDRGRVRRLDRLGKPRRILRPISNSEGRVVAHLSMHGQKAIKQVSVLVLEAFVEPRPPGMWGCHNDGDPSNNNVSNLRWDTPQSNYHDMYLHGTHPRLNVNTCPRGHLLVAPNLKRGPARLGHRACLACGRAWAAVHTRRRRGLPELDFRHEADRRYAKIMGVEIDGRISPERRMAP